MNGNFTKWVLLQVLVVAMLVVAGSALAAPGDQLIHNSNNMGTKYGNWGVAGGKYGEFTCTTCHSTRVVTTNNVKRVAGTITAPLGNWSSSKAGTVQAVFNNMTAFGTDATAHTTSTAVCQVCHSKTSVHRYDKPVGQAESDHQGANQTDCTACHSHANAFKPQGCVSCHGGNLASGTPMATGQHTAHINNADTIGLNYGCVDCHAKTVTGDESIKSAPTAHRNGTFGDYSGIRAGKNYSAGNCSNVYCHTNGKGGAPATAVNWSTGPALDCKGCHGGASSQAGEPVYVSGAAGSATANSHPKHVGTTGANATCQNCHGATMNGTVLNTSAKHTDGTIDVALGNGKSFSYTEGTKTCATASCHSNGFFTPADAQWGAAQNCAGCHGDAANAATKLTGAHNAHLNGGAATGGAFGCVDCHAPSVTDNTTLKASGGHMNSMINFSSARAYKTGFNQVAGTCSTKCHTNGIGGAPAVAVTWAGPAIDCSGCHGNNSLTITTNVHSKHLAYIENGNSITCATCHNSVTTNGNSISNATLHIDGTVSMTAGGTFNTNTVSFTPVSGGCNSISCHGGSSAAWNTVPATCDTCHPKANLSGAHKVHMGTLDFTSTSTYYNMTANRTLSNDDTVREHGFGCTNCHPMAKINHINGSVDIDMNRSVAGVGSLRMLNHSTASYAKGGTLKCSNIYCHSNASRVEAESNVGSNTSLGWTDKFSNYPASDRCAYCHGNQPTTGAHSAHAVGNHYDNIFNGKSGKVPVVKGKGNIAHGNPINSTTIGCYICHQATVGDNKGNDNNTKCSGCHDGVNADKKNGPVMIANLKNHVNGAREIQFPSIQVRSKAQIRPKIRDDKEPTKLYTFDFYSGIWARTSYKNNTTLSYDIAKLPLDTATMWHPGAPMTSNCTNVACHNGKKVSWNLANWNDPNKCMDCHSQL